jgi:hypothetical protein
MSGDHLPDDLRHWPRDPYQVLGVASPCDPREARKAYTRLIRRFKPEQYPDHFQRIREAYDALKLDAQYFGSFTPEEPADGASDLPDGGTPEPVAAPELSPPTIKPDLLQVFWDMACNDQEDEAYRGLREMFEINPHGSEVPARLYAMLLANPELDPVRTPCDWLLRGMRTEGPWGPCRVLYRREIDDHPEEVLSDRFVSLLDQGTPLNSLAEFLAWRWEALQRLERIVLIDDDLKRVAGRLEQENEEGWVHLLLRAADYLAWQWRVRFEELGKEIETHVHVHVALAEDLSRLDFLRELSGTWGEFGADQRAMMPLVRALPLAWTNPFENRHRLLVHCRPIAENPALAFDQLDEVQRRAPLVPAHLAQTLAWLWPTAVDPRDEAALASAITDTLGGVDLPISEGSYLLYRRHLLRLCVAEVIAPETVAAMLSPDRASFVYQRIHDDWPLRLVCLAHRLIWA